MLPGLGYSFVNSDGSINVADPAGAPPSGDSCLQATADDSYTLTALVPVTPENLDTATQLDTVAQVGIAIDGVTIFGDAPSGTGGTIPALDPCGGGSQEDGATPTDLDACNGHTSTTPELGTVYHYHLSFDSPNLPTCRVGAVASGKLTSRDNPSVQLPDSGGPGGGGGPPGGGPPG